MTLENSSNKDKNTKNLSINDGFASELDQCTSSRTTRHVYNPRHVSQARRSDLELILAHFASNDFPRTISTKTTEGRQRLVNDKEEALARYKQANYFDCRINAYTELDSCPNLLFADIDNLESYVIEQALNTYKRLGWQPTVLFTGSGYHIYQPVESLRLEDVNDFAESYDPSRQFLKFSTEYLADGKADPNHNPSFRSCMLRIPGSINSKNGNEVKVLQKWNGQRPSIVPLLGIFYSWLATNKAEQEVRFSSFSSYKLDRTSINWIESLLKTPLDDYRKTIANLVLAPYLVNIRQLQYDAAFMIIKSWLEQCTSLRKLDFNADYITNAALVNARKTNYKPMRLDTLKQRNPEIYKRFILN
jgi:hypothetical protein